MKRNERDAPERRRPRLRAVALVLAFVAATVVGARHVRAEGVIPPPAQPPDLLSLDEAVRIFRARGLDLLIAEAAERSAEGAVKIAGAVANPVVSATIGNSFTYSNTNFSRSNCLVSGAECSPWAYSVGISDSAALADALSGKRDLRLRVARNALAAAKLSRVDSERVLLFQLKAAYLQVAEAAIADKFAREVASTNVTTLRKFEDRYRAGAISEGDLERIETQKLESDQAVDSADQGLRQARLALAFLLGVRGDVSDFDVDTTVLDFSVPNALRDATPVGLLRTAFDQRPDLLSLGYLRASAEAQIQLVKRQRVPDLTLAVTAAAGGFGGLSTNAPIGPQTVTFGVSAPLPIFYQLDGELRQAQAQYDTSALQHAKATAQVVNDVGSAFAAFAASRRLVERMEGPRRDGGGLLASAKGALDVTAVRYEKGAASLTDYLDALRSYIAIKLEYFGDLTSYWTAVFQLESAVAKELR